jgi:hypothetical protein
LRVTAAVHRFINHVKQYEKCNAAVGDIPLLAGNPRMWLRKASVTFLIKLATSVARGGAEPMNAFKKHQKHRFWWRQHRIKIFACQLTN